MVVIFDYVNYVNMVLNVVGNIIKIHEVVVEVLVLVYMFHKVVVIGFVIKKEENFLIIINDKLQQNIQVV